MDSESVAAEQSLAAEKEGSCCGDSQLRGVLRRKIARRREAGCVPLFSISEGAELQVPLKALSVCTPDSEKTGLRRYFPHRILSLTL